MTNDVNITENQKIVEPGLTTVYLPGIPLMAPTNPIKYTLSDPSTLPGTVLGGIIGSRFGLNLLTHYE